MLLRFFVCVRVYTSVFVAQRYTLVFVAQRGYHKRGRPILSQSWHGNGDAPPCLYSWSPPVAFR